MSLGILEIWRQMLWVTVLTAAPFLLTALIVGVVTALLQAATQVQENVVTFVPKVAAMVLVAVVGGPFILSRLGAFTQTVMELLVAVGRSAG